MSFRACTKALHCGNGLPLVGDVMDQPTGTVTFLFTDIEGSTRLWEAQPASMRHAHARHGQIIAAAVEQHHGHVVRSRGEGDSTFSVFPAASDALAAACALQQALAAEPWPAEAPIRVRAALHTGSAVYREGDYNSSDVNRCARLRAIAHGGQTLVSASTVALTREHLPVGAVLRDMGSHRLKDLQRPEHVWQLCHPDVPDDFPALRSLQAYANNLPIQLSSFVGREREMEQVTERMHTARLVTLTGAGGAGKTRLALQVAAEALEEFGDGVWLVELASLGDAALVVQQIASTLGVKEIAGRPLLATLADHLLDKDLLLLLDNCEHLVEECARVAEELLQTCADVKILATSREPLNVAGEHAWRVPSLDVPPVDGLPFEEKEIAAALVEYDGVRLFVDRAREHQRDFRLRREFAGPVARICKRLDGIPLALELAAACVRSMSVEQIDRNLDDRFRLLTTGRRTALPRQQTLRATVDWSYELLTTCERLLLDRLAVFVGGWTLEAAQKVCCGNGVEMADLLGLLDRLVDRSLVQFSDAVGEGRYALLETVRQYGMEKLGRTGEITAIRSRHLDYFLYLANEAESHLAGRDAAIWLDRLEVEHDNFRAALDWCESLCPVPAAGLQLAGALHDFWSVRGYWREGRGRLARMLASSEDANGGPVRAKALNAEGDLALKEGEVAAATASFEAGLAIYRALADKPRIAATLALLGNAAYRGGNYRRAIELYQNGLALYEECGDRRGSATSMARLGAAAVEQGDYPIAVALHQRSLAIHREIGDAAGIAGSLYNLGSAALWQGDVQTARTAFEESLTIRQELGDRAAVAGVLHYLANVAQCEGNYAQARFLYEQSLCIRRDLGNKPGVAWSLTYLGFLGASEGDYAEAKTSHEQALELHRAIGDRQGIAHTQHGLAEAAYGQGDLALSKSLCEECRTHFSSMGNRHGVANALLTLGLIATKEADLNSAQNLIGESLEIYRSFGGKMGALDCLGGLATVAAAKGDHTRAARLLGAMYTQRVLLRARQSSLLCADFGRATSAARAALGVEAFDAAWEEGCAMGIERAIAYALEGAS